MPVVVPPVQPSPVPSEDKRELRSDRELSQVEMAVASDEVLFDLFAAALAEPGLADEVREQLFTQLGASGEQVHWTHLDALEPVQTLARAVACAVPGSGPALRDASLWRSALGGQCECLTWWRALLARHNLACAGDAVGGEEFIQLIVSAFRTLRDRYASEAFQRNLRTVRCGAHRLADRYDDFEYLSRAALGKTYRCRSTADGAERFCRQVRKDRLAAPADEVRGEADRLRRIEHPNLPRLVECLEDFNSFYMVSEPVRGLQLPVFLRERLAAGRPLGESWLAAVARQVLEVLRHLHEQRPRSYVHGDLHLESLVLSQMTEAEPEPHVVIADLGLADLLRPHPPRASRPVEAGPLTETASPRRDVWSCGCLLHLLLAGRPPCGTGGSVAFGDPLLPLAVPTQEQGPDFGALAHASPGAEALCAQMLAQAPAARPSAAACLRHPWLKHRETGAGDHLLPLAVLEALVRLGRQRELCQVVTRDVVAELTFGSCSCPIAAFEQIVAGSTPSGADGIVTVGPAAAHLLQLGISVPTMEKAVRAFDLDGEGSVALGRLAAGCAELAEDRLDHTIWQLFIAAGEDHRGAMEAADLAQALNAGTAAGAAGSCPTAATVDLGGAEGLLRALLDTETLAEGGEVVQQLAQGGHLVTFEAFKAFVIQRHNAAFAAKAAACSSRAPRLPRLTEEGSNVGQDEPRPHRRLEAALLAAH